MRDFSSHWPIHLLLPFENSDEVMKFKDRIAETFDCFLKTENVCVALYNRCTKLNEIGFNGFYAEFKCVDSTQNMNAPGVCVLVGFRDHSKDFYREREIYKFDICQMTVTLSQAFLYT